MTGASSGIGRATVELLRSIGADVYAVARRADRLAELAEETGSVAVVADLTDAGAVAAAVERIAGRGPCTRS